MKPLLTSIAAFGLAYGLATPAFAASPDPTAAFEQAFATSLYVFDACGDPLSGEMFRKVLAAKIALCPIPDEAMKRYHQRSALLLKKEKERINKIVEERGGLPNRIEGMTTTCHEQQSSPDYVQLRDKLDSYVEGKMEPNAVIPGGCDAATFAP